MKEAAAKPRAKKKNVMIQKVINLLEDPESWCNLEKRSQYAMLGFNHDTSYLLYTEDYTKLKLCPTVYPQPDYLWEDIHLTKRSGFPRAPVKIVDDLASKKQMIVYRARCAGVKVTYFLYCV